MTPMNVRILALVALAILPIMAFIGLAWGCEVLGNSVS